MASSKLNPSAPPFPRPCSLHFAPPAPPMMLPYHAGLCPPFGGAIYVCAQFPVHSPHHPFTQSPVMHQSRVFCKTTTGGPAPPARFLCKGVVSSKKPPARVLRQGAQSARVSRKSVPAQPTKQVLCEGTPAQPENVLPDHVGEPVPHGLPPHKLMTTSGCGAKKPQAANEDVALLGCRKEPSPDCTATTAPDQKPAARLARRKAERGGNNRKSRARKVAVVGPRATSSRPRRAWARAPSSTFTTPRQVPLAEQPPAYLGSCTTVMVRNIPNRLKVEDIMALLDQHCANANRGAVDVLSAYDVVYLPTDFRKRGNFGYAFVNFTTAAAARGLYHALQGRGWKVCGSRKTIEIVPARIQGKEALVRHLSRHKFEREHEEYRPAVFSPPRDGGVSARDTTTTRVGKLVVPP